MRATLDPDEVLQVATAHLVDGVEQQIVARLLGINIGRVNEACQAIDYARNHVKEIYAMARAENGK